MCYRLVCHGLEVSYFNPCHFITYINDLKIFLHLLFKNYVYIVAVDNDHIHCGELIHVHNIS